MHFLGQWSFRFCSSLSFDLDEPSVDEWLETSMVETSNGVKGDTDKATPVILHENPHLKEINVSHTCKPGEKLCSDRSSSPRDGSWFSKLTTLSSPLADRLVVMCPPDKTDVVITEDMLDGRPGDVPFKLQSMFNSEILQKIMQW